jgi:polysaccharide biosynthesis transport protein
MNQAYGEATSFSIIDVLRGMGQRKLLLLSSLALGTLIGIGVVVAIKPKYQAEARILIDNVATPYDNANVTQSDGREKLIDERIITSQVAVLQSQDMGMRVINDLNLTERASFDSMKSGLGLVKQMLIKTGFSDDPRVMTVEQRAYDALSSAVTVYPIPLSNVIGIKVTSSDGPSAAEIANALAEKYVLSTREVRSNDTDRARTWLSSQIDGLRQKVAQSDAAVEKFRAEAGLLKGQTATLGTQEISELNSQITLAEAARSEAEAKANEIRGMLESQGTVEASSEVLSSSNVQRLNEQQLAAERRLNDLSVTYLPNHPKMKAASREIADINRRIRREALKIVDGLQGQAKIAAARASSLRNSLEGMKDREGGVLQEEVKLKELEREAKANRDQLELMLARFADTNTRQNLALQPGFARVIQTASAPAAPFFPKVGPIVLLASLAGLGLGLGLAFLFEIMAQASRLTNPIGVEEERSAPRSRHPARHLAEDDFDIPALDVEQAAAMRSTSFARAAVQTAPFTTVPPPPVVANIPVTPTALAARSLLMALGNGGSMHTMLGKLSLNLQAMRNEGAMRGLVLAGVGGGHEVAVLSLALGRQFADSGLKTILVDLDATGSLLPDMLDLAHAPGLMELLSGASDFSKAIQRDKASTLQFLRCGHAENSSATQLVNRMESVTQTLLGVYDIVILYAGEASPATPQMVKGCNTVLLNTPSIRKKDATAAVGTLKAKGFQHVFLVQIDDTQQVAA